MTRFGYLGAVTMTSDIRATTFGGLTIEHGEGVLTPRPWTLLQSDWAVELEPELPAGPILELCCGVGHIGLEVVRRTDRHLVQVDLSELACSYARSNAVASGRGERVTVRCAPLLGLRASTERFGLVLADPPYLTSDDVGAHPEDPHSAIDGGADGLDLLRECVAVIDTVLAPGGTALVQVRGAEQAAHVAELIGPDLTAGAVRSHDPERAVLALHRPEGVRS